MCVVGGGGYLVAHGLRVGVGHVAAYVVEGIADQGAGGGLGDAGVAGWRGDDVAGVALPEVVGSGSGLDVSLDRLADGAAHDEGEASPGPDVHVSPFMAGRRLAGWHSRA